MHAQHLTKQIPGQHGIDDIAQREHRVSDCNVNAGEPDDPDKHADAITEQAADDGQLGADGNGRAEQGTHRQRKFTQVPDARLEQQLRGGIKQDAGEKKAESAEGHCVTGGA